MATEIVRYLRRNYESGTPPKNALSPAEFLPKRIAPEELELAPPVEKGRNSKRRDGRELEDRWDVLTHLVRWAALLHDVAHVPAGHTLEDEFDGIYPKHDDFRSPRTLYFWAEAYAGSNSDIPGVFLAHGASSKEHPLLPESFKNLGISGKEALAAVTLIALHKESEIDGRHYSFVDLISATHKKELEKPETARDSNVVKSTEMLQSAIKLANGWLFHPYMADIVGNTICADYLDYVKRDPANVGLDVVRDNRVLSRFFVGVQTRLDGAMERAPKRAWRMALALTDSRGKRRLDTCTGVVELVRQRFRFAEIIYYHKSKVAASAMLAKALALIGTPPEIPSTPRGILNLSDVEDRVHSVFSSTNRGERARQLRDQCAPTALLDVDIGDDSMLLWLQYRAWETFGQAAVSDDRIKAASVLRGLSLLQGLVRRRLYKVKFAMDAEAYAQLTGGTTEEEEIEKRISEFLRLIRSDHDKRSELERDMANAAGWPVDSLLLYVPGRKSQAKGIETGALEDGDVVTLGQHSAVRDEVKYLGQGYKNLWRTILLVHPDNVGDSLGLSEAVDVLSDRLMSLTRPHVQSWVPPIHVIAKSSWFPYINRQHRQAAVDLREIDPNVPSHMVESAMDSLAYRSTSTPKDHAARAYLFWRASENVVGPRLDSKTACQRIRKAYPAANDLIYRIDERRQRLVNEGRKGDSADLTFASMLVNEYSDLFDKKR